MHDQRQSEFRLAAYLFHGVLLLVLLAMLTVFYGVMNDGMRAARERQRAEAARVGALRLCAWQATAAARDTCRLQQRQGPTLALAEELPSLSNDIDPPANVAYR